MGLGKTEASLITAEQLATKTGRSGLLVYQLRRHRMGFLIVLKNGLKV